MITFLLLPIESFSWFAKYLINKREIKHSKGGETEDWNVHLGLGAFYTGVPGMTDAFTRYDALFRGKHSWEQKGGGISELIRIHLWESVFWKVFFSV